MTVKESSSVTDNLMKKPANYSNSRDLRMTSLESSPPESSQGKLSLMGDRSMDSGLGSSLKSDADSQLYSNTLSSGSMPQTSSGITSPCDSGLVSNCSTGDMPKSSSGSTHVEDHYNHNDDYSNRTSMQSTRSFPSDAGYSSANMSEHKSSVFQSTQTRYTPRPDPKPAPTDYFKGTLMEFLKDLAGIYDFRSWDPIKDIKDKLSPELLDEARELLWEQDEDKEFEALTAARDRDERVVAFALYIAKSHKQLNIMNAERQTVLHIAVERCSAHLCRLLITRGADGAIADVWGDTPLHIAARCGRADVIKALCTTLTKSEVYHPYFRVPYKSLPQDNVQSYNHDGRTPVHLAAQEPHSKPQQEALRALVKYARADIDYRRLGDGYAPAHIAIDNDDYGCLETCLKIGADSEVRNFKGETPQQLAYLCCDRDEKAAMVQLCQKHGAGEYQLLYAETECLYPEDEMEVDAEDECVGGAAADNRLLQHRMEQMTVG